MSMRIGSDLQSLAYLASIEGAGKKKSSSSSSSTPDTTAMKAGASKAAAAGSSSIRKTDDAAALAKLAKKPSAPALPSKPKATVDFSGKDVKELSAMAKADPSLWQNSDFQKAVTAANRSSPTSAPKGGKTTSTSSPKPAAGSAPSKGSASSSTSTKTQPKKAAPQPTPPASDDSSSGAEDVDSIDGGSDPEESQELSASDDAGEASGSEEANEASDADEASASQEASDADGASDVEDAEQESDGEDRAVSSSKKADPARAAAKQRQTEGFNAWKKHLIAGTEQLSQGFAGKVERQNAEIAKRNKAIERANRKLSSRHQKSLESEVSLTDYLPVHAVPTAKFAAIATLPAAAKHLSTTVGHYVLVNFETGKVPSALHARLGTRREWDEVSHPVTVLNTQVIRGETRVSGFFQLEPETLTTRHTRISFEIPANSEENGADEPLKQEVYVSRQKDAKSKATRTVRTEGQAFVHGMSPFIGAVLERPVVFKV